MRPIAPRRRLALGAGLLAAVSAGAEDAVPAAELWEARVRGGVSFPAGAEASPATDLAYTGASLDDELLTARAWLLGSRSIGLWGSVGHEGFSLLEGGAAVTRASLWRVTLGPVGRLALGPVRLELGVAWAWQQLPRFGPGGAPRFQAIDRHALMPAVRGQLELGPVALEARLEVPLTLALSSGAASASGVGLGAGARVRVATSGSLDWGAVVEASWSRDTVQASELSSGRSVARASLALDVRWREPSPGSAPPLPPSPVEAPGSPPPAPAPRPGWLEVQVLGQDGAPFPGATVAAAGQTALSDARGTARLEPLAPGTLAVTVQGQGQREVQEAVVVVAGQPTALRVTLRPATVRALATLAGLVRNALGGEPVRARLEVVERRISLQADGQGAFAVPLPGGTYTVRISASGYLPQVKVVRLKDGDQAILNVDLSPR
jgi:hypothetical protein